MSAAEKYHERYGTKDDQQSEFRVAANQNLYLRPLWRKRKFRYGILFVISMAVIWGGALAYLMVLPPEYKSKWTLIIPGSGTGSTLNLENVGQASTSVNSAYATSRVDPKVNYKAIALSRGVLNNAAESLGISPIDFGKPKIKLIDQTTLLEFSVSAQTAVSAYEKSISHNAAFQAELRKLRENELQTRRKGSTDVLNEYQANVGKAQAAVLAYKSQSSVVSTDQLQQISSNIESLKRQKAEAIVTFANVSSTVSQLTNTLNISAKDAANALKLQTDPIFQSLLEVRSAAHAELVERKAIWGDKHPKVMHSKSRVSAAASALFQRATKTTTIDASENLDKLIVSADNSQTDLFNLLITQHAEKNAISLEIDQYAALIEAMEADLQIVARQTAKLEDLERTHQAATAVFVSAAAKSDLGQSDIYASYPMTQMLVSPSVPESAEHLKKIFTLLGAGAGSLVIILSLAISWKRHILLQKLQKSS